MAENSTLTILALGGAGCRIIRRLSGISGLRLLAVDTDKNSLAESNLPPDATLLAAESWRNGRGCGGNTLDGQRSIARERAAIEQLLHGSEMLVVIGGLGGGTCSGGAEIILSICRKLNIPAVFLLTLPFTLEGHSKRRIAEETLRNELQLADAVITLPNDLLFSVLPATTPLRQAFELADTEQAAAALALTHVLRHGSLLAADFDDLAAVLRRRKSYCSLGSGTAVAADAADSGERCRIAMERMMLSPLLGGAEKLGKADVVLFSLIGGSALTIGETKAALEHAATLVGKDVRLLVGATSEESFGDRVQICAVAVKYDAAEELDAAVADVSVRKMRSRVKEQEEPSGEIEQLKFALDTMSKGIMEKTTPVIWNGADLDFPTFQRRNMPIDIGRTITKGALKEGKTEE